MKERKIILSYYKRRLYKGRTALARIVDFIALRLVMLCAAYLWFSSAVESTLMAIVLSATATLTASVAAELIKSIRIERFIQKERKALAAKLFRERLVQLSREEFMELVRGYVVDHKDDFDPDCLVCTAQSAAPVSEDDVLRACRSAKARDTGKVVLFTSSSVSSILPVRPAGRDDDALHHSGRTGCPRGSKRTAAGERSRGRRRTRTGRTGAGAAQKKRLEAV